MGKLPMPHRQSHGDGQFELSELGSCGEHVVMEAGVLIFHPENIHIGSNVYVGHQTILKGYHQNTMRIGAGTWIGQQCFFHSAGGLEIENSVGIGPQVKIITSTHALEDWPLNQPIIDAPLDFAPVRIGQGTDIGVGATILPGVKIGAFTQIGAGAVVSTDIPSGVIAAGVPAKILRMRS